MSFLGEEACIGAKKKETPALRPGFHWDIECDRLDLSKLLNEVDQLV